MATFKALVLEHQRRADGSYNVKIRITHNRRSKYLQTSITAYRADLTRNLDIRPNTSLWFLCNREIEKYTGYLSELGVLTLEAMTVDGVVEYLKARSRARRIDFFEYAERFIATKSAGTAKCYRTAVNSFARYLGTRELDINSITATMIRDYMNDYISAGRGGNSAAGINLYVNELASIFNSAKDEYNDDDAGIILIPRNPFKKVSAGMVVHRGQEPLTVEEMQRVISYVPVRKKDRMFLDIYVISFALMGMNIADLAEAKVPGCGILTYCRKKTRGRRADRAEMSVRIPECIRERVARVSGEGLLISPGVRGMCGKDLTTCSSRVVKRVIRGIIGRDVTMYSARHSFATFARNECGVDKATVDECLVHITQEMKLADVYIKRDWKRLWEVQEKVLDLFEWQ